MTRLKLHPWFPKYAKELLESHRYKVLYGGRGGARSWTVARMLLFRAAKDTLRSLCTRELQRSIRGSVHQLLRDQIILLGIPGYTVTDTEIRHVNGSLFIFLGLRHNVNEIKSLEGVDICWVEEAEAVPHHSWEALIPTVRKPGSEIWVTFNPDLETDSTYRRFVLTRPPGAWVKKVSWRNNKWLPPELEAERRYLRKTDHDAYDHVWEGECRKSSAAQVLHGKWVVDDLEQADGWDGPYYGVDFGFGTDPYALVELWIEGVTLHVQRELYRVGLDLDRTARACQEAAPGCEEYVIRADNARPESISYLRALHEDPTDHEKYALPRMEACEKWSGSIQDGIAYLRSFERIVVHSRCKHWIAEAKAYSYKVDERSGDILPVILDKDNNCLVGETLVNTADGAVAIRDLVGRTGIVPTLDGPRRYHSVRETRSHALVYRVQLADGRGFSCTAEHPILTASGWLPAIALSSGVRILDMDTTRYEVRGTWGRNTSRSTDIGTAGTTAAGTTTATVAGGHPRHCTERCGSTPTARSRAGMMFTIASRTNGQLTQSGSAAFRRPITRGFMARHSPQRSAWRDGRISSSELSPPLRPGTEALKVVAGTLATPSVPLRNESTCLPASSAVGHSSAEPRLCEVASVQMAANPHGGAGPAWTTRCAAARIADNPSQSIGTVTHGAAHGLVRCGFAIVESVTFAGYAPVYNMEVEGAHHFPVAGGLIVHNCIDATRYALGPMIRKRESAFTPPPKTSAKKVKPLFGNLEKLAVDL